MEVGTGIEDADTEPASLQDIDVGVVRARFGVAETGSVWFSEREYVVNALGYIVQHLVVLLDPSPPPFIGEFQAYSGVLAGTLDLGGS